MTRTGDERRQDRYERRDAAPGAAVQSMDGARLGTVAETRGRAFRVHTGLFRRDYWLEAALISAADEAVVVVRVLARDIPNHRLGDVARSTLDERLEAGPR